MSDPAASHLFRRRAICAAAATLTCALILVPAASRATQRLRVGPSYAASASGLHKSIDKPADPKLAVAVPGDARTTGRVVTTETLIAVAQAAPEPVGTTSTEALRAPPCRSLL